MSWFDASSFTNIAKSALREAQRTIDKALDIKDEEPGDVPANIPIDTNPEDFFGTWGLTESGKIKVMKSENEESDENEQKPNPLQASLWGSFSGSFFNPPKDELKSPSIDSLDDSLDMRTEHFSGSKLVVQHGDDVDCTQHLYTPIEPTAKRLSVVSDNGKSSESVELLTCSTECTTSPESEVLSVDQSISTSSSRQTKQTSESLEILLDSPSSIDATSKSSPDEFSSPAQSPMANEEVQIVSEKVTEFLQAEELEESLAEDTMSYTSVSESTSATVVDQGGLHLKPPPKMLKDTFHGLHLPLNQVLIDTQPQSSRQGMADILKNTNIIDIPQEGVRDDVSNDESSQSDKTLVAMDSSSDTSIVDGTSGSANSVYLKTLIADAMAEKSVEGDTGIPVDVDSTSSNTKDPKGDLDNISITQLEMPPRENSPISSESRSDLVKIGSDHTSGDELETTTSSDIEIISSPNGDSSSTQSRQSPAKQGTGKDLFCKLTLKKSKGHTRELSGASSISDDSHPHPAEPDRMMKRISEMTEILESRESKLIDMNRRNAELQESNEELKRQLEAMFDKQMVTADVCQVTDEYTQRLAQLEKKLQQAIMEKDVLRKQVETSKQEVANRMSRSELETIINEKDEVVKELREEGEKLSKQQLQHSNIIKKLRAKEKENEATIKKLKETVESLNSETERLKRSLTAKEEVERSQIEAVHQLTAKNKKIESELTKITSQFDDLNQKHETTKRSLEAAKKELLDKNRASSELIAREQMLESLENEKRQMESQNTAILGELEDLRSKVRQLDVDYVKKEQLLRKENGELLRRLEDAETRNEELSQSILEVSKPLVRQLESLQATHGMKLCAFEKIEQELVHKISELQNRLQTSVNSERLIKDELSGLRSKLSDLESEISSIKHQNGLLAVQAEQQKTEKQMVEQDLKRQIDDLQDSLKMERGRNEELIKECLLLKEQVDNGEKLEENRCKTPPIMERGTPRTSSNSPTLSLGKAESLSSSFWSQDDNFDNAPPPRYSNMFEMQMLQTNLKQKDGEVLQLQWELNRREQERSLLNTEISNLLTKVEDLQSRVKDYNSLKSQFESIQQQYDTLCQLYGEKVEENEELKLDLSDIKEAYKSQIDELLKQQKSENNTP